MRLLNLTLSAVALAALAGCAAPGTDSPESYAAGAGQCFYNSDVRSFTDAGPNAVLVALGANEAWELTLQGGCPNVSGVSKVGLVSRGRTRICAGSDAELIVPNVSGAGTQRCLVTSVRKLTPQEAANVRN